MRKLFTICASFLVGGVGFTQAPVTNPYYEKYDTCPAWTNEIIWTNVTNIHDYPDSAGYWDAALDSAMADVNTHGGGVVYFPAGDYDFLRNVQIPDGVVLRGDMPLVNNAKSDSFAPPSHLNFPKYEPVFSGDGTPNSSAFKVISQSQGENVGLVHLDINRGRLYLAAKRNLIVFGVRQNNVAVPQGDIPGNYSFMNGWQRFAYRHGRNVTAAGSEHVSVVNNRINDFMNNQIRPLANDSYDQPGFIAGGHYDGGRETPTGVSLNSDDTNSSGMLIDTTHIVYGERAKFSYTDHYGIGVYGAYIDPDTIGEEYSIKTIPDQKIEIIDNWVYNTMRVGIFGKGYGLTIKGNVRRDDNDKRNFMHATGWKLNTNNAATLENRALNFAGHNMIIEDNDMRVYRHQILYSGYLSVDGEGILMQTQDKWGHYMDGVFIRNNKVNAYIGLYDLQFDMRNIYIEDNNLMNQGNVYVFKKESSYRIDDLYIRNNDSITGISMGLRISDSEYEVVGSNIYIQNNSGTGSMKYPCQAIVENNTGFTDDMACSGDFATQYLLSPYFGQRGVAKDQEISIEFNEQLTWGNSSNLTLIGEEHGAVGGLSYSIDGSKLIVNHNGMDQSDDQFTVTVDADVVRGQSSDTPNEYTQWSFFTASKPWPLSTFPSDSATGILTDEQILVEFNQEIKDIDLSQITVKDQNDDLLSGLSYGIDSNILIIDHNGLQNNIFYTVNIPAGVIGNGSDFTNEELSWSFKSIASGAIRVRPVNDDDEWRVYPNPVEQLLSIKNMAHKGSLDLQLYNMQGQLVKATVKSGPIIEWNIGQLPGGYYVLRINEENEKKIYIK